MTKPVQNIEAKTRIRAARAHVWRILTEPEFVNQWLGCMRYQKSIGHVFYMQQDPAKRQTDDIAGATHCEILDLVEQERFAFSWYMPGTPETRVEIRLESIDDELTDVTLVHSGWDKFDPDQIRAIRDMLDGGWRSYVMPQLKQLSEIK